MTGLDTIIGKYLDVWNETDAAGRSKKIAEVWAETGRYTDPLTSITGRRAFDRLVAGAQEQFKGLRFFLGSMCDEHHNVVRFNWNLAETEDSDPVVIGFDVAVVGDDGLIDDVYGFIDRMPSSA